MLPKTLLLMPLDSIFFQNPTFGGILAIFNFTHSQYHYVDDMHFGCDQKDNLQFFEAVNALKCILLKICRFGSGHFDHYEAWKHHRLV